ncbi:MAG: hypothetical protein AAFR17_17310, partial [Pseudomonadota bacterium]
SFYFAEEALDQATVEGFGAVDVDGPAAGSIAANDYQLNFDTGLDDADFGEVTVAPISLAGPGETSFLVKGSIFGNPDGEGEAALYQQSNGADERLIWLGEGATEWRDYTFDVVIEPGDNDTVGAIFYHQDDQNFYQLTMDQQNDERVLVRVRDGVETELARETASYRHFAEQDLRIAVLGGEITITLDDELMFGGVVVDEDPLKGGSVGLLGQENDRVKFDNVSVNPIALAARALTEEKDGRWAADLDGDGTAPVSLTAEASLSAEGITLFEWLVDGEVVASGEMATLDLAPGETTVTLRVTDAAGAVSEDDITVSVASNAQILLSDDFADGDFNGWTIVDEGDLNGPSDWQVVDGALVQASDIQSDQQGTGSTAFSVEGDGPFILRDGTYALFDDPAAAGWRDYAFEATITPNDDDGIGLLFRYVDAENYYKLEADAQTGLIMLTRHLEGRETILARGYNEYTPGEAQSWRIEVEGGVIRSFIDGKAVFGTEVEDRTLPIGTVGLYGWGSEGLVFDDVLVTSGLPVITGTPEDDRLFGTEEAERILAGDGNDRVTGREGADEMDGGAGLRDVLIYRNSSEAVDVDLGRAEQSGGDAEGDITQGFEGIWGSDSGDLLMGDDQDNVLFGFAGDDTIDGKGGDDRISGGGGADSLDGGAGLGDTLVYRGSAAGVEIDLASGSATGGAATGDLIANFERVQGSEFGDILTGDAGNNVLQGFGGTDVISGGAGRDLISGGAGADDLDGGAGLADTVSYASSDAGVSVDLATGTASGGDAEGDSLQGFEQVIGSRSADEITGDAGNNRLTGLGGDDMFIASAGEDQILGGAGTFDTVVFAGAQAEFDISGAGASTLVTDLASGDTDTLTGIEVLVFSDGQLLL